MHIPVLLHEVIEGLKVRSGGVYLDCTFGAGGYTRAILNSCPDASVVAIDRDESVLALAENMRRDFGDRFRFLEGSFASVTGDLCEKDLKFDGIVADIGISSMQVDVAERGFSFQNEGRLDMRMSAKINISAFEVVNFFKEGEIADIIFKYGDESKARKIAQAICTQRRLKPIETTSELAMIVLKCYGEFGRKMKIHPATQTFQALRIFVNQELDELLVLLQNSLKLLKNEGVLAIVSFHSLEDRIVKDFFRNHSNAKISENKYANFSHIQADLQQMPLEILTKKPIEPTPQEVASNPRSRSAKLRIAKKFS